MKKNDNKSCPNTMEIEHKYIVRFTYFHMPNQNK